MKVKNLKFAPGTPIDMVDLGIYRSSWVKNNTLTVEITFPRNIPPNGNNEIGVDILQIDEDKYREYEVKKWKIASRSDVQKYLVPLMEKSPYLRDEIEDVLEMAR